jgi:hypothetical protein
LQADLQFTQQNGERQGAQHVENYRCNRRFLLLPAAGLPAVGKLYCRPMTLR